RRDAVPQRARGGRGQMIVVAVVFWVAVGLLIWTHLAYPAAARVAARLLGRRVARDDDYLPSVDVIVTAHNEGTVIAGRIANLQELDYPRDRLELVVTSDASTDRTDDIAVEAGARVVSNPRGGKVAAQNRAVRQTRGEIVAFSDANC